MGDDENLKITSFEHAPLITCEHMCITSEHVRITCRSHVSSWESYVSTWDHMWNTCDFLVFFRYGISLIKAKGTFTRYDLFLCSCFYIWAFKRLIKHVRSLICLYYSFLRAKSIQKFYNARKIVQSWEKSVASYRFFSQFLESWATDASTNIGNPCKLLHVNIKSSIWYVI